VVRVRLGSGKWLGLVSGLALMSPVLIDCLTYEKPEKKTDDLTRQTLGAPVTLNDANNTHNANNGH